MADNKKGRSTPKKSSNDVLDSGIQDSRSGVKELQSALNQLTSVVSGLTKQFRTMGNGSKDIARQIGVSVIGMQDLTDVVSNYESMVSNVNSLYQKGEKRLQGQVNSIIKRNIFSSSELDTLNQQLLTSANASKYDRENLKYQSITLDFFKDNEKFNKLSQENRDKVLAYAKKRAEQYRKEIISSDALLVIQDSQIKRTQTELQLAELTQKQLYKQFVTENNLQGASNEIVQLRYKQYQLDEQIALVSKDTTDAGKELLKQLQAEKVATEGALKTQKDVDAILKSQTAELKKQEILKKTAENLEEKIKETLGEQFGELEHIGHAIKDSMVSPLALVGALLGSALEEFGKIGRDSRAFLETTKLTVEQTEHVRHYAHDLSLEYRAQGVQMKDVLNSTGALVGQFGSLNRVSDGAVEKATLLGKAFGISADNAAGVMAQLQRSTGVSAETAGNIAALGANFAKAAGVAPDAVMQDIATSSNEIAKYFKGTPKDLFRTAVEARRLGLDLKKVASISQNLLNFESSIEDQMTASVLLGREINLDKARQLAMEGKIQEAAEETLKQVGSLSDFNKLNAVQKEAVAKAAGMEVGDLQKSLEAQEAIKNMTSKQRAEYEKGLKALNAGNEDAGERLLMEQRNQLTQEKIADAVAKISDIFANVLLPVLEPIFDIITGIFNIIEPILPVLKTGLQLFLGWKAVSFLLNTQFFKTRGILGTLLSPIEGLWKGTVKAYEGSKEWVKSLKEGPGLLTRIKSTFEGFGNKVKTFFLGSKEQWKSWSVDSIKSIKGTEDKTKGFFGKFKDWVSKFSFNPIEKEGEKMAGKITEQITGAAENATKGVAESVKSKGQEIVEEKAGGAVETLQGKAEEKVASIVESKKESAVESLQGKAEEKGGEMIESVTGKADEASKVESKVKSSPGEGIKTFLKNLGEGLTAMGTGKVLAGALNLIPASIGLVAMIPGLVGAKLLEKLNGAKFQENMYGLAYGLEAFGPLLVTKGAGNLVLASAGLVSMIAGSLGIAAINTVNGELFSVNMKAIAAGLTAMSGTLMGSLALGAFAVAAALAIPSLIFLGGISLLGEVAAAGLVALGVGLEILGGIAATGLPFLAIGLIASLGASMIPFAIALETAMPAIDGISKSISNMLTTIGKEGMSAVGGFYLLSQAMGVFALASMGILVTLPVLGLLTAAISILGPALTVVGTAVISISSGFQLLVSSINQLNPEILTAMSGAFFDMSLALGTLTLAIVATAALAPAAVTLGLLLGTLGASAILVGVGLKLAEGAIASITASLINLVTNVSGDVLKSMTDGLFSLAGGIGTLALASVGFLIAIPAVGALTVALGALGPVLMILGMGVQSVATGFQSLVASINQLNPEVLSAMSSAFFNMSMALGALTIAIVATAALAPAALLLAGLLATLGTSAIMVGIGLQIAEGAIASITNSLINLVTTVSPEVLSAMKTGLFDLAMGIGSLGLASLAILPAIPALAVLTGAMALLGPVLKVVGDGMNYISVGFQNLANAVKQINPETMWSMAAAFGSVALALGALSVAIVATAIFAPAAVLLAGVMMTLGASAIMVGIGLGLAANAIESITNSLITMTSSINPSILDAMKAGLFSLAEGIGAVGLAAIGFTLAVPSVTLFSLLMGTLGSNLMSVGAGMISITSNLNSFITSVNTLLPMLDQINLLTTAFSDLATSIGEVGIASMMAFPAMAALSGITSLLGGLFGEEEKSIEPVAATPTPVTAAATTTTTAEPAAAPAETPAIDISGLMAKMDSLIAAVNNQPIQLVVNGKVLAEVVGRNTTRSGVASSR